MLKNIFSGAEHGLRALCRRECIQIVPTRQKKIFKEPYSRKPIREIRHGEGAKTVTMHEYKEKQFSRPGDNKDYSNELKGTTLTSDDIDESFIDDDLFENRVITDNVKRDKIRERDENANTEQKLKQVQEKMVNQSVKAIRKGQGGQIKIHGFHPKIYNSESNLVKMLKSARVKFLVEKQNCLFVEGWRIIADFLATDITPKGIFFSRTNTVAKMNSILKMDEYHFIEYLNSLPIYKTPYSTVCEWSALKTPPGMHAVFDMSEAKKYVNSLSTSNAHPITVILDGIKDPQNMGGLMRTIAAAGVQQTILTEGCCNPWDIRTIRASSGGLLKLHFRCGVKWATMRNYIPANSNLFLAHACQDTEDGVPFLNTENEPSQCDQIHSSHERISEMSDQFEYSPSAQERDTPQDGIEPSAVAPSTNSTSSASAVHDSYTVNETDGLEYDASYDDPEILDYCRRYHVPSESYETARFCDARAPATVLVVGSECGLGAQARKFASEHCGTQVHIPMAEGIDSLNNNAAGAIILFEICRQHRLLRAETSTVRNA